MKKYILFTALMIFAALFFAACQGGASPSDGTGAGTDSGQNGGYGAQAAPADDERKASESVTGPNGDSAYSDYPVFEKIETVYMGGWEDPEDDIVFMLSDEERAILWLLMRVDEWVVAEDLPAMGVDSNFRIIEEAVQTSWTFIYHGIGQAWGFSQYYEHTLIIPALPDENSQKICYFAPADVLIDIIAFAETLTASE